MVLVDACTKACSISEGQLSTMTHVDTFNQAVTTLLLPDLMEDRLLFFYRQVFMLF